MFDSQFYHKLIQELNTYNAALVAVSKKKPVSDIQLALDAGQQIFGENYVQELCAKQPEITDSIEWHFIGHLQRNKVKNIAPFIHTVQTIDNMNLLAELDKAASRNNRIINVLLQVYIATEETKFGFDREEVVRLFEEDVMSSFKNIRVAGLMGMASNTNDTTQVRNEFNGLFKLFRDIKPELNKNIRPVLSMGMTSDYKIALDEGSTMIRIGSALFGSR